MVMRVPAARGTGGTSRSPGGEARQPSNAAWTPRRPLAGGDAAHDDRRQRRRGKPPGVMREQILARESLDGLDAALRGTGRKGARRRTARSAASRAARMPGLSSSWRMTLISSTRRFSDFGGRKGGGPDDVPEHVEHVGEILAQAGARQASSGGGSSTPSAPRRDRRARRRWRRPNAWPCHGEDTPEKQREALAVSAGVRTGLPARNREADGSRAARTPSPAPTTHGAVGDAPGGPADSPPATLIVMRAARGLEPPTVRVSDRDARAATRATCTA
jgi:hypothetical protein